MLLGHAANLYVGFSLRNPNGRVYLRNPTDTRSCDIEGRVAAYRRFLAGTCGILGDAEQSARMRSLCLTGQTPTIQARA